MKTLKKPICPYCKGKIIYINEPEINAFSVQCAKCGFDFELNENDEVVYNV